MSIERKISLVVYEHSDFSRLSQLSLRYLNLFELGDYHCLPIYLHECLPMLLFFLKFYCEWAFSLGQSSSRAYKSFESQG